VVVAFCALLGVVGTQLLWPLWGSERPLTDLTLGEIVGPGFLSAIIGIVVNNLLRKLYIGIRKIGN